MADLPLLLSRSNEPPSSRPLERGWPRRWSCVLGICLALAPGCTLHQYEISRAELERLAETSRAERGQRVRALQQTAYDQDELGVDEEEALDEDGALVLVLASSSEQRQSKESESNDDDEDDEASELAAGAALVLLVTGVVLVPVAVTEGVRYDGFVEMTADQPLYLVGADRWVRLEDLSPEDARASVRAVAPDWGGPITRLERRPLDRVGFGYTLELGGAALPPRQDERLAAYGGRLQLGGHPSQQLGVFIGGQFAYGSSSEDRLFLGKLFGAVEFFPAALGIFHAGVFAEGGYSHFVHGRDTSETTPGAYFSAGPVLQLALSTRLALTLRGGMSSIATTSERVWLPEGSLGVAVY